MTARKELLRREVGCRISPVCRPNQIAKPGPDNPSGDGDAGFWGYPPERIGPSAGRMNGRSLV